MCGSVKIILHRSPARIVLFFLFLPFSRLFFFFFVLFGRKFTRIFDPFLRCGMREIYIYGSRKEEKRFLLKSADI